MISCKSLAETVGVDTVVTVTTVPATATTGSRGLAGRAKALFSRQEWTRLGAMFAVVAALHVIGWGTLVFLVAPQHFGIGDKALGAGVGLTAYALGMRHAFDADHIAAIDNTTRSLMTHGRRPLGAGFFFSLGHSSVVFVLAAVISFGLTAVIGPVADRSSALHHYTGLIGTGVSGAFLYLIAAVNIAILAGILRVFRGMRRGEYDALALENHLANRGLINRLLGRFTRSIRSTWQMYPLGILFGLGFDTATEIALLVLAGSTAAAGLPWYAILCLPVIFAAGMTLFDTIDGSFMNVAYGWASARPVRTLYYNITMTGLSVAVALIVGTAEILGLFADQLGWRGGFWDRIAGLDLNVVGFVIVGMFVATWLAAMLVWRFGRVEERMSLRLDG
jgi:high-affinity nickel-transport protein